MKLLIEKGSWGGDYDFEVSHFFCESRDSLKNVLNRQEITRSLCEKKNLDQKVDIKKKLEHFSEKKYPPLHNPKSHYVKDFQLNDHTKR